MYGAILGDIIGSPYEFDMGNKSKDFPLFSKNSTYTDDTVMTIAVADAFMDAPEDEEGIRQRLIASMQRFGKLFPRAGYGGMFRRWLRSDNILGNEAFLDKLASHVTISVEGDDIDVHFIDFEDIWNNDFIVTNQYWVQGYKMVKCIHRDFGSWCLRRSPACQGGAHLR